MAVSLGHSQSLTNAVDIWHTVLQTEIGTYSPTVTTKRLHCYFQLQIINFQTESKMLFFVIVVHFQWLLPYDTIQYM